VHHNTSFAIVPGLMVVAQDTVQAVKFWKSGTTQPSMTGHSKLLNVWNGLPDSVRDSLLSENVFAKPLKSFFINRIRRV